MDGRVVIGGSSGFMGTRLQEVYRSAGREVVTISRSGADLTWDDTSGIAEAVDGAALVVGLAGKSVGCRYHARNRAEIFSSRELTTAALSRAIASASAPPPVWVNSSTATIYRHAEDRPMTESTGELGTGFSVDVAKSWERVLFADDLPGTRRVALRTAIVLGHGGVLPELASLTRWGMGGTQCDGWWPVTRARKEAGTAHFPGARRGKQKFSWIHIDDVVRAIDHLEAHPELDGPVNLSTPNPVDNATLMATLRKVMGVRFGPPLPRWALEVGGMINGVETELILKSRWVLPERLLASGFTFRYPELEPALREALS
ncbi:TIGR01777 family oxidoreductase [Brevibacterium samyangense]|uniref:TIGR01777 family oxidoreductase n=2 Tax=Brevibacterium samyangense TaxID=366888 RepID=A0ABN2TMJ9_9MICO